MSAIDLEVVNAGNVPVPSPGRRMMFIDEQTGFWSSKTESGEVVTINEILGPGPEVLQSWVGGRAQIEADAAENVNVIGSLWMPRPGIYEGMLYLENGGNAQAFSVGVSGSNELAPTVGTALEMVGAGEKCFVRFAVCVGEDWIGDASVESNIGGVLKGQCGALQLQNGGLLYLNMYRPAVADGGGRINVRGAYIRQVG